MVAPNLGRSAVSGGLHLGGEGPIYSLAARIGSDAGGNNGANEKGMPFPLSHRRM